MTYGQSDRPEAPESERERKRAAQANERAAWANFKHVYERCIAIAEQLWNDKLEAASAQQQALAEAMRDRQSVTDAGGSLTYTATGEIPVPLFTPRDRLQFIKEVSTALLISSERRNLTAYYKDVPDEIPQEAASGADETALDAEAAEIAAAGSVSTP